MTDMSATKKIHESVFRAHSRREFDARDELLAQGIPAEVPMELHWRKRSHYKKQATPQERPIMTAYVIVRERRDSERLLNALSRTRHVGRYVGSMREGEMSRLHRLNGRKINEPRPDAPPAFKEGQRVTIKKGRYADIRALVIGSTGQAVRVVIQMFGSERQTTVSAYDLRAE